MILLCAPASFITLSYFTIWVRQSISCKIYGSQSSYPYLQRGKGRGVGVGARGGGNALCAQGRDTCARVGFGVFGGQGKTSGSDPDIEGRSVITVNEALPQDIFSGNETCQGYREGEGTIHVEGSAAIQLCDAQRVAGGKRVAVVDVIVGDDLHLAPAAGDKT